MAYTINSRLPLDLKVANDCLKFRFWLSFRLFLVLWAVLSPNSHANEALAVTGKELLHNLESGGFNIYFRHAETNWDQMDGFDAPGDWKTCDPVRMRQLSDLGRENSARVGKAIRTLDLPIGKVVASPYCRTMETAMLMNLGVVEPSNGIINLRIADYFGGRDEVLKTARQLLATKPARGTNAVFVAHGNVAREATLIYPAEAEGVVFRPDGAGGFDFIARLTPDQWEQLVTLAKSRP